MTLNQILQVTFYTLKEAACSSLIALLIGFPLAFFCAKRDFFFKKIILSLSIIPYCMPTLIIALGYVSFLGINGTLNKILMALFNLSDSPLKILYTFTGLVLIQGFYNFPIITKTVSDTWKNLSYDEEESAELLGATPFRIFYTITLKKLLPSVTGSLLLVFINCFLSFILVLLFAGIGKATLEVKIYSMMRNRSSLFYTLSLASLETFILLIFTSLHTFTEEKTNRLKGIKCSFSSLQKIKGKEKIVFFILMILVIFFFIFPLIGIIYNAFSFNAFSKVIRSKSFLSSLFTTVFIAVLTAFFCTVIAFFYSVILKFNKNKSLNITLKIFAMLPMCVSSVVTGLIIILLVPSGNFMTLVAAQVFLFWPLAFRQIQPCIQKIDTDTMQSAILMSKNKTDITKRILFPVCKNGILSAFGFCFAVSAGDTSLPLVLGLKNFQTLSLFTYKLAGSYRLNQACASGVILTVLCILVLALTYKRKSK